MSVYEEKQLLRQLKALGSTVNNIPKANRLKRKLIVRQVSEHQYILWQSDITSIK